MIISESIIINATSSEIWEVLINPEIFKDCFQIMSIQYNDLKVGESISFISLNQIDNAILTEIVFNKVLAYDYYKSNSQHFIKMRFEIIQSDLNLLLKINGSNFVDAEEYYHSQQAWKSMLITIKNYIENKKS